MLRGRQLKGFLVDRAVDLRARDVVTKPTDMCGFERRLRHVREQCRGDIIERCTLRIGQTLNQVG